MSLKKIIVAVMAVAIMPLGMQMNATTPKKKTTSHKTSHKSSKSSSTKKHHHSSSKTVSMKDAQKAVESTHAAAEEQPIMLSNNAGASSDVSGETVVKTAMQYLGVPYRLGTSSPKSFDCSGFTSYVFKAYDIKLSRSAVAQYSQGRSISKKSDLRAGDLVFFQGRSGKGGVGHVGIVTEVSPSTNTFTFVHASCRGVVVDKSTMAYYSSRYIGARRVLPHNDD